MKGVIALGLFRRRQVKGPQPGPFSSMVVVAAGKATRMGEVNKILQPIGDLPVIGYSLLAMEESAAVREVVVVSRSEDILAIGDLCKAMDFRKVSKVVAGGASRTASALIGLNEISPEARVAGIHDGARPCVTPALIDAVMRAAAETGAAAPGAPVVDTLKAVDGEGCVSATVDREKIVAVQTPQAFEATLIRGALTKALHEGWELTDDCAAVERLGMRVRIVPGLRSNIKVTVLEDLLIAQALLGAAFEDAPPELYRR